MNNKTAVWSATIFSIAIIIAVLILSGSFKHRYDYKDTITVKGMAEKNFTSDLIVWEGEFSVEASNIPQGYSALRTQKDLVLNYLKSKGLADTEIIFKAIEINKLYDYYYDEKGNSHSVFKGYSLVQGIKIMSKKVETVEDISRSITELIEKGVYFTSYSPRYYYTKLNDLKIQMIAEATENAKLRAEQIAKNANASLGKLKYAKLGVFQITGLYSDEDYSWGGTFNTSSKLKTATVTVTLQFQLR